MAGQGSGGNVLAAICSFFIPGLGHIYKGHIGAGIFFLAVVTLGYVALVIPGLVLHLIAIYRAYSV